MDNNTLEATYQNNWKSFNILQNQAKPSQLVVVVAAVLVVVVVVVVVVEVVLFLFDIL